MPAATTKADLLFVFDRDKAKLDQLLATVTEQTARAHAADDPTSVKAVIAHRTHWMAMFFTWYDDGKAGRTVHIPAKGYKWNQLKAYNATLYQAGDSAPWAHLLGDFETQARRLRAFIEACDGETLYAPNVWKWTGKWPLGRWAEASGPSHFRSATIYIRKALRNT